MALLLVVCLIVSACNGQEESSIESDSESSEAALSLTQSEALSLIERDKTVTDMFINNSLCDGVATQSVAVTEGEYADFSAVENLLSSTYTEDGGNRELFKGYPENHSPSVSGIDGKTFVFNHAGSRFDDFIDRNSVSVRAGEDADHAVITAKTVSGIDVELIAVCEDGTWRLKNGLYRTAYSEDAFDNRFPMSYLGSFMEYRGEVLVIELFVSDNVSEIDDAAEDEFHKKIKSAFDYITAQSEQYGNAVNVTYERGRFDHAGVLGTRALDFDIMFAETGFGSLMKYADANFDLAAYDNFVFVVCLNKNADISYNGYEGSDSTQLYFAERAIIGNETTDVEICLSMLKLLGAYSFDEQKIEKTTEDLYRAYFPHDIMVSESLTYSVMSPVTAYACGITDGLSPLYRIFWYEK